MNNSLRAPELGDALQWVNSDPVRLGACAGRVVALAFFNAGSAYSRNLVDTLHHLVAKHPRRLQVIGLHIPKYPADRDPRRVADAVQRLGIRFPVASDIDCVAWQHYGIRGWPSLSLIDGEGELREQLVGDIGVAALEQVLAPLLAATVAKLDDEELDDAVPGRRDLVASGPLAYPCGIAVNGERLFIADSGHHRILECNLEGRVLVTFGTGHPDLLDGAASECAFNAPQSLLLLNQALYVADTGNHAVRRIDLVNAGVETVAGTGQSGNPARGDPARPRDCPLNRPWGLAGDTERVYVSLAGDNRIWALELRTGSFVHVAGSGELGHEDGPAQSARLAQPCGLSLLRKTLYFADASGSALRSVSLGSGEVRTLAGKGLFEFGDADGPREHATLAHPLGLALQHDAPVLWVADSANDRLRTIRLGGGGVATVDLGQPLRHPVALAMTPDAVWITSTDAHQILRHDIVRGGTRIVDIIQAG